MATEAAVTAEEEADLETLDVGEGDAGEEGVDEELEAMKKKVKEMEDEAEKLNKIQNEVEEQLNEGEGVETNEADGRSIYIGNVDYSVTPEELQEHFAECGTVNRVTILCDKFRNPKGYAFVEFAEEAAVEAAVALNDTELKGRQIKVVAKRTNVPGMKGGKGGKGKVRGRGKGYGKGKGYGGYRPFYRPRYRGRGYRPY